MRPPPDDSDSSLDTGAGSRPVEGGSRARVDGVSVVVPVYNEAGNILPLAREIRDALAARETDFEILYVDDASTDATAAELAAARREISGFRLLRHRLRSGQSAAVLTGVRHARYGWIATLDGDGQNDPMDIPGLVERLETAAPESALMLVGWRRDRHDSWLRRVSSRVANRVRSKLLGDETPDSGCGLKLFEKSLYLRLPYFDHMHRFLPALARRAGVNVESVPVNHRPRLKGRSKYGLNNRLWVGIIDMFGVMWLMRRGTRAEADEIVDL